MAKCPVHNVVLSTYRTTLTKMEKSYDCVAGTCPKCKHIYLNIAFFHHYDEIEIQGNVYLYNDQLASEFPAQLTENGNHLSNTPMGNTFIPNANHTTMNSTIESQTQKNKEDQTLLGKESVDKKLAALVGNASNNISPSFDLYTDEMISEMELREV